jgi:hypothetical protein
MQKARPRAAGLLHESPFYFLDELGLVLAITVIIFSLFAMAD